MPHRSTSVAIIIAGWLALYPPLLLNQLRADEAAAATHQETFHARDSLGPLTDASPDAQRLLAELGYRPAAFTVVCTATGDEPYDAMVRFPSPKPSGDAVNDMVVMEWYAARDEMARPVRGPAMVVLHILSGQMRVARLFAGHFARHGVHAFVMHMPHYGLRSGQTARQLKAQGHRADADMVIAAAHQAAADARRARDAIAALPNIDPNRIGIQGTSLGGFVTTFAAALDDAFSPVFITLAGGDVHSMLAHGMRDSARIRSVLAQAGFTGQKLRDLAWRVEPLRVAHRLNARRTWMFNGLYDSVVPIANARRLAEAAGLDQSHHFQVNGDHYSAAVHLPTILRKMVELIEK